MRIAIVEDMATDARHLMNLIQKYYNIHPNYLDGQQCHICVFKDFLSFQKAFLDTHFQIVFLDIYLSPTENGYDIARQIRHGTSNPSVPIIFTTSSREYAVESYEVEAFGYLMKPIGMDSLDNCLNRLYHYYFKQAPKTIKILSNRQYIQIPTENIMYIVANGNGSSVISCHSTILTSMTVESLQKEINSDDFLLAKRGHLVNLQYVEQANEVEFIMKDGRSIPLRVKGCKELLRLYKEYRLKQN